MRHGKSEPSQRQLRVGEQLRQTIAEVLQRGHFRDPGLSDAKEVTVTEVRPSPDLKNATVYVMPLGGYNAEETVEALNRAASYVRGETVRKLDHMRHAPRLSFMLDRSFSNAERIGELLHSDRVARDLEDQDEDDFETEAVNA